MRTEAYKKCIRNDKEIMEKTIISINSELNKINRRKEIDKLIADKNKNINKYRYCAFYTKYVDGKITLDDAIEYMDKIK